ncbi:uncharacterized protein LOC127949494 isoform X2 [Carassius gibelio]|uniref:uncharacterized protein LOC127949494 isoform X2 n=1 Tax=Carassius gibelio TaxID=101364 RepID=UPI002279DFA5|nr:uncharacterized protein LOC127949494 isoform X2 [Carassius gibelio]
MKEFIKLTDHIFEEILYSDVNLRDAKMMLEDVVMRRLPKCVGETRLQETEEAFKVEWTTAVYEWNKLHPDLVLYKKDFSTEVIKLDYNKEEENPIKSVYFYRKKQQNKGCKIRKYEISSLLPKTFSEQVGRVYYTKNSDEEEKDAKDCFIWWRLGKCVIELYDQNEFNGSKCVVTENCSSLDCCSITEVRSCKVIRGVWDLSEGRDYAEPHYQLKVGEYPNPGSWGNGNTAPALSVKCLTSHKIQLFENEDFEEPMHETTVNRHSLDGCGIKEVRSCKVLSGFWDLYEGPDYAESRYQLKVGEYPNPGSWCASDPTVPARSVKHAFIQSA